MQVSLILPSPFTVGCQKYLTWDEGSRQKSGVASLAP